MWRECCKSCGLLVNTSSSVSSSKCGCVDALPFCIYVRAAVVGDGMLSSAHCGDCCCESSGEGGAARHCTWARTMVTRDAPWRPIYLAAARQYCNLRVMCSNKDAVSRLVRIECDATVCQSTAEDPTSEANSTEAKAALAVNFRSLVPMLRCARPSLLFDGATLLHMACARGDVFSASFFIERGLACVCCRDGAGRTPLHMAAALRRSSEVTEGNSVGAIALGRFGIESVAGAAVRLVSMLLSHGADVDGGRCPCSHIQRTLINTDDAYGSDGCVSAGRTLSPLPSCCPNGSSVPSQSKQSEGVKTAGHGGLFPHSPLELAIAACNAATAALLIANGAAVGSSTRASSTRACASMSIQVCGEGSGEAVGRTAAGDDEEARLPPLHAAAVCSNGDSGGEILLSLLNCGADVEVTDGHGGVTAYGRVIDGGAGLASPHTRNILRILAGEGADTCGFPPPPPSCDSNEGGSANSDDSSYSSSSEGYSFGYRMGRCGPWCYGRQCCNSDHAPDDEEALRCRRAYYGFDDSDSSGYTRWEEGEEDGSDEDGGE